MILEKTVLFAAIGVGGTLLLLGLAACSRLIPAPTGLGAVAEAVDHPEAASIAFTGIARTSVRGVHRFGTKHNRSVGKPEMALQEMWVVPVDDPGAAPSEPVTLWVTPSFKIDEGQDPSAWFEQLSREFDGKPMEIKVRGRADEADAGWAKAIADAERELGVRSHPKAIVVPWPPKG